MFIKFTVFILLGGLVACSSAQLPPLSEEMKGYPVHYVHAERTSIQSQLVQIIASLAGVKNIIEKQIKNEKFSQETAPIPSSLTSITKVTRVRLNDRDLYTVEPINHRSNKVVFYIHGGAHVGPISKYTWVLVEELVRQTGASFVVPDYPLLPDADFQSMNEYLFVSYEQTVKQNDGKSIVLMGDSSGGGMALSLAMIMRDRGDIMPEQVILLSPWLDATMSSPDLDILDTKDSILGVQGLKMAAHQYSGNVDLEDYRISPIFGSLENLPTLSIFIGTHDILFSDARALLARAYEEDVKINYFEYPKMFHIWIFLSSLPEAKHSIQQIASLILQGA